RPHPQRERETPMRTSPTQQLNTLLANRTINNSGNDAMYVSGWNHSTKTLQVRLTGDEAQKVATAIKGFSKSNQRKLVRELFSRTQTNGSMGSANAAVALDDDRAASIMNGLAAGLGIMGMRFRVNKTRPIVPMG